MITSYIVQHWLDIFTTILGLVYIYLEYRASIALWFVGIIMPAMDVYLYYSHGLYGDAGMAVYYTFAVFMAMQCGNGATRHDIRNMVRVPLHTCLNAFIFPLHS